MKLLIVDENSEILDEFESLLAGTPHTALYASDGEEALHSFEETSPDAVLCGLMLPKLGGLELIKEVRERQPELPFVLTAKTTNPEPILQALSLGACDFLTKPLKPAMVQHTLNRIESLSKGFPDVGLAPECLVQESLTLEIGNDFEMIPQVAAVLTRDLRVYKLIEPRDQFLVNLLLKEALENAIFHGNLELSAQLREGNFEAFHATARLQSEQEPYCDRKVVVQYEVTRNSVKYIIRDEGKGFAHQNLPDAADPENLFQNAGRGLVLIHNFMDVVLWNERGNEITFIRYRKRRA
jgi:CheY-like chemotaxis protein/anti-sigma regulatory factor (Ser/Thr protein kinase)